MNIEKSILITIAFFDAMNLPVTPLEIYRNLFFSPCLKGRPARNASYNDAGGLREGVNSSKFSIEFSNFLNILKNSEEIKLRTNKIFGMYSLKSNNNLKAIEMVKGRQFKYRMAIKKWIIARGAVKFFEIIPFCQAVFMSGSLTRNNTSEGSDIDILIIGEHDRLWTVRAFAMLVSKLLGRHRSKKKIKDMFCLNHFISDKDLEIKHQSIYTAELYSKLVPVFSREDVAEKFREDNFWIKNYLPYAYDPAPKSIRRFRSSFILKSIRSFLEFLLVGFFGDLFEKLARAIQRPKIKKGAGMPEGRIIFTDEEIELHPDSPERKLIDGLNNRLCKLGLAELAFFKDSGLVK